ncbi:MAG TPA: penicillin acylase family protein, partial [Ignavibacteria bacterium]|nr:penicillin acylase family protein [Ignavibacteria bacterium]
MRKWLKITIGITASLIILIIVGGIIFYSMLKQSLPKYTGIVSSGKIFSEIKIYRDSMGVPYIFAKDDEDAAFALGYVHAQDRLFSMDLMRRAGEGRLSEIFGPKTLPFDEMFRTVGIERTAKKLWNHISPTSRKLLQAYCNGVNFYIKNANGHYPIEFDILGYKPEKWTPVSSL